MCECEREREREREERRRRREKEERERERGGFKEIMRVLRVHGMKMEVKDSNK